MNLYTSALGQIPFKAIEEFLGLDLPIDQRIPEGQRIDYNIQIAQDIGNDVASFANSDGALIFIGVRADKAKQNVPVEWPGLSPRSDYATQITSKILSTVRPRPDFDIGWASLETGNFIFVVRVRAGTYPPYEYTQGNTTHIPIRVHDGKKQATVRDIEALFERRALRSKDPETALTSYLNAPDFEPRIGPTVEQIGPCHEYQRIVLAPTTKADLRLDTRFESDFQFTVFRHFSETMNNWEPKVRGSYFQVESRNVGRFPTDFLWRIYSNGTLALTASIAGDIPDDAIELQRKTGTMVDVPRATPIGDLASNLLSMCSLASDVFAELNINGDVNLAHLLRAPNVKFTAGFPTAGRQSRYVPIRGLEVPTPQAVLADRTTTFFVVDTSELGSASEAAGEILMYSLRETRGIRFDREQFLNAVTGLEKYLAEQRKNVR